MNRVVLAQLIQRHQGNNYSIFYVERANLDGTPNPDEQDRFNDLGLLLCFNDTIAPETIHFIRRQIPFLP